jgi:PPP family 3-phenylpropionic acid transporter
MDAMQATARLGRPHETASRTIGPSGPVGCPKSAGPSEPRAAYHSRMRWLRVLYLANGAVYGTWGAFMPVVLTWKGFDAPLVALTSSLGSVAFWLVLPVWGHLGDEVLGTKRALQLAAIPAALLLVALDLPLPVFAIVLLCVAGGMTGAPIAALTDAHTVSGLADPEREYGRLRMLGSLAGGIAAIAVGLLYDHTGYVMTPLIGGVSLSAVALIAFRMPQSQAGRKLLERARSAEPAEPAVGRGRFGTLSEALRGRPRLILLLLGCLGIFTGIMGGGTFITLRLQALGGGPSMIGFANGFGPLAEVPGMLLASWLIVRYGVRVVLGTSAFGLAAVFASWALVTEPALIVGTKVIGGVFFAGVTISFVLMMATILPQRLVSTGQTLYQSVGFGAAAILSNLVGALLYKLGGSEVVFVFLASATAVVGVVAVLAAPAHGRIRRARDWGEGEPEAADPVVIEPASSTIA